MRRDALYLHDIIEACRDIAEFLQAVDITQFRSSKLIRSAVIQKLMVIGEAASRISAECKASYPAVPWTDISAFRNRIVHGYFQVDWDIVWIAAAEEASELVMQVESILSEMEDGSA
jgi:uncharacterized protein with HEPN domain